MKKIFAYIFAFSVMLTFSACAEAAAPDMPATASVATTSSSAASSSAASVAETATPKIIFLLSAPDAKGSVSDFYVIIPANGTFSIKDAFSLGKDKTMEFVSADSKIATVDAQGVVAWKGAGQTQINLSAKGANPVALRIICSAAPTTPPAVPATSKIAMLLKKGASVSVKTDSKLNFVSENPEVATVDENGTVTWKSEGQVNIIVSTEASNAVSVLVTCEAPATVEDVTLPENSSAANKPSAPQAPEKPSNGTVTNPTPDNSSSSSSSEGSTASGQDTTIEIEDDDSNRFEVGAGIKINDYYESGSSRDQVLADIDALAKPYGLIVTKSGFIGNGSSDSAGKIRVSGDDNGNWNLVIYAWRSSTSETGFSASMNTTLQVMKYFLGDENGANLWSFWDAAATGQNPSPDSYGISDNGGTGKVGSFTFGDGSIVAYDQSYNNQTVFTLT